MTKNEPMAIPPLTVMRPGRVGTSGPAASGDVGWPQGWLSNHVG